MHKTPPMPNAIAQTIAGLGPEVRPVVTRLRRLILSQAAELPGTDGIEETLKWGQASYLPRKPRVGTTVRLGSAPGAATKAALFVHCQTGLIETYRQLFPSLDCAGNRAIVFDPKGPLPEDAIRHCIRLALTYHIRKRQRA